MSKVYATVTIDQARCKGCTFCVLVCEPNVLVMSQDYNEMGYHYPLLVDTDGCTGCEACARICPDLVFEVYRGGRKPALAMEGAR